jgi:hypothetical protein
MGRTALDPKRHRGAATALTLIAANVERSTLTAEPGPATILLDGKP